MAYHGSLARWLTHLTFRYKYKYNIIIQAQIRMFLIILVLDLGLQVLQRDSPPLRMFSEKSSLAVHDGLLQA